MAIFQNIGRRIRRKTLNKDVCRLIVLLTITILVFPLVYINRASSLLIVQISGYQPYSQIALKDPTIDWTKLAYVEYVTSPVDLCKALMLFSQLHEVSSNGLRVLMYPSDWSFNAHKQSNVGSQEAHIGRLLRHAVEEFSVVLQPTDALRQGSSRTNWSVGHTRLLGYNLTQYQRVITFGFDSMVAHSMDELFFMPPTPLAMPYIYWNSSADWGFSDQIMVIQPSTTSFRNIEAAIASSPMDHSISSIVSQLYERSIIRIPQRPYHILTQEFSFKDKEHSKYLGSSKEKWDPRKVLLQARLVHFFDPPLSDPWTIPKDTWHNHLPKCLSGVSRRQDCSTRNVWGKFYSDYQNRRKNVCGAEFEP